MAQVPLILSIPHSGTRSLRKVMGCDFVHVYIREDPGFKGFWNAYLVSPLRDPRAVWESWVKRWNTQQGAVSLDLFEKQYRHLEAFDREYRIVYIPVDGSKVGSIEGPIETDHPEPDWGYIYRLPFIKRFYD